jgi:hypothetical protein
VVMRLNIALHGLIALLLPLSCVQAHEHPRMLPCKAASVLRRWHTTKSF